MNLDEHLAINRAKLEERDLKYWKARAEAAEKELAVVIAERDRTIKATEEIGKQLEGYRIRTWGPETNAD